MRDDHELAHRELLERIYGQLLAVAAGFEDAEPVDETLVATALAHGRIPRLLGPKALESASRRRHLFGAAVRALRQALVERAHRPNTTGAGAADPADRLAPLVTRIEREHGFDLESFDLALNELRLENSQQAEIVEYRFFGGLSLDQVAALLETPAVAVEEAWRLARAKLYCKLKRGSE
jgi:RNA polymerase sigma factor (TIGR02999 family)